MHDPKNMNVGSPSSHVRLAQALEARGHKVDLFFYQDAFPSGRIQGYWRQVFFPWILAKAFLSRHKVHRYDIVQCTAANLWVTALLLSLSRNIHRPLLAACVHFLDPLYVKLEKKLDDRFLRRKFHLYHSYYRLWEFARDCKVADVILPQSILDADYLIEELRVQKQKIQVVPPAVGEYFFKQAALRSFDERKLFNLLFVGRWQWIKGIKTIERIVNDLFEKDKRYTLTCAGTLVPETEILQSFPEKYRPRIKVVSQYQNEELPDLLHEHGLLIIPSFMESAPMVLLEAMASGLVVVANSVGLAPELIRSGYNGFLVSNHENGEMAKIIQKITSQPALMENVSEMAKASMRDFTWPNIAQRFEEIYLEKLVQRNHNS
jgi:glycosyltransferase involved in cell wall biosynthesis